MKRFLTSIIVFLLVLTGCGTTHTKSSDIINKIEGKENFVVYFGNPTCGACTAYAPTVEEINEDYDNVILYVDIDKDDREERIKLMDDYGLSLQYTPTTYFVVNGEVVDEKVGALRYSELEKLIIKHGFGDEK